MGVVGMDCFSASLHFVSSGTDELREFYSRLNASLSREVSEAAV